MAVILVGVKLKASDYPNSKLDIKHITNSCLHLFKTKIQFMYLNTYNLGLIVLFKVSPTPIHTSTHTSTSAHSYADTHTHAHTQNQGSAIYSTTITKKCDIKYII